MPVTDHNNTKSLSKQTKQDLDTLLKLGLTYIEKLNKDNAIKAVKCFEAITVDNFPDVYKPLASSVYTNLAWFLIKDINYAQAEIYLNRAIENGGCVALAKLGHLKYLQNQFKESVDFYIQSAQKLGFIEEIIIEIQYDFEVLKVSQNNIDNLSQFLTQFYRNKSIALDTLVREPDESTPELTTEQGYWKYAKAESALLFSSTDIKVLFTDNQNVIDDFDAIRKHYTDRKEKIEALVNKIMIYENKKTLQKVITDANLEDRQWVWENWSRCNVVEEQPLEKRFGHEDKHAIIKIDVNEDNFDVSFIPQIPI